MSNVHQKLDQGLRSCKTSEFANSCLHYYHVCVENGRLYWHIRFSGFSSLEVEKHIGQMNARLCLPKHHSLFHHMIYVLQTRAEDNGFRPLNYSIRMCH